MNITPESFAQSVIDWWFPLCMLGLYAVMRDGPANRKKYKKWDRIRKQNKKKQVSKKKIRRKKRVTKK